MLRKKLFDWVNVRTASLNSMFSNKTKKIRKTSSPKGNDRSPDSKQVFLNSSQSRAVTLLQICRKTKIYNTNIDLVNDNVFTNFGLILSIRSQDIEQKPNSEVNQGP